MHTSDASLKPRPALAWSWGLPCGHWRGVYTQMPPIAAVTSSINSEVGPTAAGTTLWAAVNKTLRTSSDPAAPGRFDVGTLHGSCSQLHSTGKPENEGLHRAPSQRDCPTE